VQTPIETTLGDQSVRRQDLITAIDDLSKTGIPPEGVVKIVEGDWTAEDVEWAEGLLAKGMATPAWVEGVLAGDPTCLHEFRALCGVISSKAT
jgi:hypothetical protein